MKKLLFLLILTSILSTYFSSEDISYAVQFDSRDIRIDLPVIDTPNNAVSPDMSSDENGHVYVVWSDNRTGRSKIYINTKFGETGWSRNSVPINTGFPKSLNTPEDGDAMTPQVCSDNFGHVYVVWADDRAVKSGTGLRDIYFRYSKDYGFTWNAPDQFTDYRIDSDNPAAGDSLNPQIACNQNGDVFIAWEDDRNARGIYELYFRSLHIQFSNPVDFIEPYQTPEIRINTGAEAGLFPATNPVISSDRSGTVYAAWRDSRIIPEDKILPGIYFNVSRNNGAAWKSKSTRVDTAPVGSIRYSMPAICNDKAGHVYITWLDDGGRVVRGTEYAADGLFDVYFNQSLNYGATFAENDKRIDIPVKKINAKDVDITCNDKGHVYIVWASNLYHENVSGTSDIYNIFLNRSETYGLSFIDQMSTIRVDSVEKGTTPASVPKVRTDQYGNVYVVWVDKRFGTSDIFFNFSVDKGKAGSWQENDYLLDRVPPFGNSYNPIMNVDPTGHVYIAWQDDRSSILPGNYNIYFIGGFLDIERILVAGQRLGESCFIATAAYGSPFERHVVLLREFRDSYLLTNRIGKWFVETYYRLSPPAAEFIKWHPYLKPVVRFALLPFITIAAITLKTTLLQKLALAMFLTIAMFIVWHKMNSTSSQ